MLRYDRQTKPGLVALYEIRSGKRSGSILTTPEPARGPRYQELLEVVVQIVCCNG